MGKRYSVTKMQAVLAIATMNHLIIRIQGSITPLIGVIDQGPSIQPLKIQWVSDDPVWIYQWPLHGEKLKQAQPLVQEQLQLGHRTFSQSLKFPYFCNS